MLDLCTIVHLASFRRSFKEEKENHGEENGKERGEYEFAEEKQIRSLIFSEQNITATTYSLK